MSQVPYGLGPAAPAPWPPEGPGRAPRGPSRLPTIIAIVIALIAVAVAIAAWFKPAPKPEAPAAKVYSEQEIADAKKAVCDAYDQSQQTLRVTGSKSGENPTDSFIVAVNSRVAIQTVSTYLRTAAEGQVAAPNPLVDKVIRLADLYRSILLKQMAEAPRSDLDPLYTSLDSSVQEVDRACND